jgi:mRNA interferase RelE/StbE
LAWAVEYTDTARSQLRKLDRRTARRILDYLDTQVATMADPRYRGKAVTGPMGGLWRYRVGRYRVICDIQDEVLRILVLRVGGRDRIYR